VVGLTLVTTGVGVDVRFVTTGVDVDVTFVTTVCVGALTPVTALANVGVTDVTTVPPGCPVTSFMTWAKVGLTLVTHVAPDAEDTSAVLRLPTVSATRSVWFEADANKANRTAGRPASIMRFGLIIPRPHEPPLC
jgi:hypothetical protein